MPEFAWRSGRADVEVPVDFRRGDTIHRGTTKNIGAGGVFVETDRLYSVGERLALTFSLPGTSEPVAVQGEVRWIRMRPVPEHRIRAKGMGIRFVGVPFDALVAIKEFLRERERARDLQSS